MPYKVRRADCGGCIPNPSLGTICNLGPTGPYGPRGPWGPTGMTGSTGPKGLDVGDGLRGSSFIGLTPSIRHIAHLNFPQYSIFQPAAQSQSFPDSG